MRRCLIDRQANPFEDMSLETRDDEQAEGRAATVRTLTFALNMTKTRPTGCPSTDECVLDLDDSRGATCLLENRRDRHVERTIPSRSIYSGTLVGANVERNGKFDVSMVTRSASAQPNEKRRTRASRRQDIDCFDPNKFWNPLLYIDNSVGDMKNDIWHKVIYDGIDVPMVRHSTVVLACSPTIRRRSTK
jgi:hypothetical protein